MKLDGSYWDRRYLDDNIGWNIGYPSTPIKTYIDQLQDKSKSILIPGAGNAYEAEYLHNQGYNVTVIDIAPTPLKNLQLRVPSFPKDHLIQRDFFDHSGEYDLIIEHTFFCALRPRLREDYVIKMHDLLKSNGQLIGLLFDREFEKEGPPFGGNLDEYRQLFQSKFNIKIIEPCYNSIDARIGSELFFIMSKVDS